jgi:hypothetical protein
LAHTNGREPPVRCAAPGCVRQDKTEILSSEPSLNSRSQHRFCRGGASLILSVVEVCPPSRGYAAHLDLFCRIFIEMKMLTYSKFHRYSWSEAELLLRLRHLPQWLQTTATDVLGWDDCAWHREPDVDNRLMQIDLPR